METNTSQAFAQGTKKLGSPIAMLLTILILLFLGGQYGYSIINSKMTALDQITTEKNNLEKKKQTLQNIRNSFEDNLEIPVIALPSKNAALWVIANMRTKSQENGVTISEIELTDESNLTTDISRVNLTHTATSDNIDNLVSYLKSLQTVIPIVSVVEADVSYTDETRSLLTAEVEIASYYSAFPDTLPDTQISELSAAEQQTLTDLTLLTKPEFTTMTPLEDTSRDNPFN